MDENGTDVKNVEVFIEKKFLEELKQNNKVLIDLKTWKRFGRQMSSLSLKKGAIS